MEEPPDHLLFILATTELHKVPATILSRCQRFTFKRILPRDMEQQLLKVAQAGAHRPDPGRGGPAGPHGQRRPARRAEPAGPVPCRRTAVVDGRSVLDTLGLAGSTQTVQLMRLLLARQRGRRSGTAGPAVPGRQGCGCAAGRAQRPVPGYDRSGRRAGGRRRPAGRPV